MKGERYCPGLLSDNELDKQCYYHGLLTICPHCGKVTKHVKEGKYQVEKPIFDVYTYREIGG